MSVDAADGRANTADDLWDTLTGAELIQAMADGRYVEPSDIITFIGQAAKHAEPGRVELEWRPGEQLSNAAGSVHGGYIAMVLDNAACLAGSSTCDRFIPMITLNLNVDYLRGVSAGETYTVVGTCVHPGRTRLVSNAVVTDARGRPVAQASAALVPNQAFAR
ncbi:PaaI family thioesterase [Actinomadura vinacea]|uniref:PaaI family thioesterase n=1 Tax=Actinomadura vinacea TaxID=115336 RepID=A0ABN3J1G0_9ACTN